MHVLRLPLFVLLYSGTWYGCVHAGDEGGLATDRLAAGAAESHDLAVSCLVWGEVTPPLDELSPESLEDTVRLLAQLLASYGRADFDAFLALRQPNLADLEMNREEVNREEVNREDRTLELYALARELGASGDVPASWLEALRLFWDAYYETPPVKAWIPEETRLQLFARDSRKAGESFEQLARQMKGTKIEHRLVLPSRREVAASARGLNLVLGFEGAGGRRGRLLVQFMAPSREGRDWILVRALTSRDALPAGGSHPSGESETRQLIL